MVFSDDYKERQKQILNYVEKIEPQFGNAIMRVATAADNLYLDNVKVFDVIKHCFLVEMSKFAGHGLCYEAAVIAMMLLKNNSTAKLVLGTAENCYKNHGRCKHAWVEFEENGVPFAIDFAWFSEELCIPRIVHVNVCKSIIYHMYSYTEFWQMDLSKKLYALCHDRKTSYVLPWLFMYRSGEDKGFLNELSKNVCNCESAPTGEYGQFMYFWDFFMDKKGFTPMELRYVTN